MLHGKLQIINIVMIAVLVVCAGAMGLARTDLRLYNKTIWDGQYQRNIENEFLHNLPLRDRAVYAWNAFKYRILGQTGARVVEGQDGWLFTSEEFVSPDSSLFETELVEVSRTLSAFNIRLIPVIVPDKARIYSDRIFHPRMTALETRYERLQFLLERHGFVWIDLEQTLLLGRATDETFMRTDTHWSPFGAMLSAREISEALDLTGTQRFETTIAEETLFDGDLLAFIDTGPLRSLAGPLAEFITLSVTNSTTGGGSLFGDVNVPVALVGTSFSAREEFNFSGFLRQELNLDLINYAMEGEGPFLPMRQFLNSLPTVETRPELVIWEIPERYINMEETE
ncbi:alginate O-acetyltransferase AlgX-related protein [Cochlodiniinecator piscidefendens]|uniref:alginate O-acetyltransferase AlgX-related protein n=1 Tax=Cochlodiniinecator piscidefendens TaxID=2715756 RepID=UPI00140DA2D3|nr:hypothetical protein [Cochlodiniinecator piscidefendens]